MMVVMMMMTMMVMIVENHTDGHSDNHAATPKENKSEATATTTITAKIAIMAISKPNKQNNEDDDKLSEPHGVQKADLWCQMRAGQNNNLNETKSNYIKSNQTNPIQYKQLYLESDQIKSNQVILSSIQSKSSQTKQNKIVLGDTPSNRDYLFFVDPYV